MNFEEMQGNKIAGTDYLCYDIVDDLEPHAFEDYANILGGLVDGVDDLFNFVEVGIGIKGEEGALLESVGVELKDALEIGSFLAEGGLEIGLADASVFHGFRRMQQN